MSDFLSELAFFISDDPFIHSKYLLFVELTPDCIQGSPQSHILFLLWFIVYGREEFHLPLAIPQSLRDFVTAPNDEGHHLLMRYLADQDGQDRQGDTLRAWYYREGVPQARLAAFLRPGELAAFRALAASGDWHERDRATALLRAPSRDVEDRRRDYFGTLTQLSTAAAKHPPIVSVSIVGYHRSVLGLGEDARCLFNCLCEAGVPTELVDASPTDLEPYERIDRFAPFESSRPTGSIVIFCLPAIEMVWAMTRLGLTAPRAPQYRIGYWPWETSALPSAWAHVYDLVDEVWASTAFLRDVYRAGTGKPVVDMPLHVDVATPAPDGPFEDLLDGRFTFLSVFDFNSRILRKNPVGAIQAFKAAFKRDVVDVRLLLKTLHAATRPDDLRLVLDAIGDDERIVLRDAALPKAELCSLIARSDAYVSLHRSEGFGRPIAEAMLLRTPVIATGWSGCADFLDSETGWPVRSRLRPVARGEYPFAAGDWAEPDLDHAAALMRDVYLNRAQHGAKTTAAQSRVELGYGITAVSDNLRHRLAGISAHLRAGRPTGQTARPGIEDPDGTTPWKAKLSPNGQV